MKGEITRKYLVHYPKSMIGKQVTGYDRSSLLGGCILPRVQDGEGALNVGTTSVSRGTKVQERPFRDSRSDVEGAA